MPQGRSKVPGNSSSLARQRLRQWSYEPQVPMPTKVRSFFISPWARFQSYDGQPYGHTTGETVIFLGASAGTAVQRNSQRWAMTPIQIMWACWGVLVLITFGIYLYRGRLSRDEDDEIFLGEGFEHERAAQAEIAAKVARIEPVLKIFKWLTVVVTVVFIGYWLYDMLLSLHLIG